MSKVPSYVVKEIFGPTLQGEGTHAGRSCVFLRFAGCNLRCTWCDTDFAPEGAARMAADEIAAALLERDRHRSRMVVVTGGEPTLQWDPTLAEALRGAGFRVHMESNGTRPLQAPVDWLTVSPKPRFHGDRERLLQPHELPVSECKVVVDDSVDEDVLAGYERHYQCAHWLVQPCMDADYGRHLARATELATRRPRWRLSLQLHKLAGVP
ncbi:7-carboxy-7-deazaguanine synthase QueE [Haliangium sp.]|uniref:7-carboxy-7-deazaguanine synthase QueE n=1 Tax=Haliangium sp. TaxID=2663208 RepID=UPI003D0F2323